MTTKNKKVLGTAAALLIVLGGSFFIFSKPESGSALIDSDMEPAAVPAGWYTHTFNSNLTLLTKQEKLPSIGATEGWAYGEQIAINTIMIDKPVEEWVEMQVGDDATTPSKTWGTLNGRKLLRVEQEVGAAGKALSYLLFNGNQVQVFTLYPLEPRNDANISAIEQVVSYYAK